MKRKVKIIKQPKRTIGNFSNLTEDQLKNGLVYGFREEPFDNSTENIVQNDQVLGNLNVPIVYPDDVYSQINSEYQNNNNSSTNNIESIFDLQNSDGNYTTADSSSIYSLKDKYKGVSIVDYLTSVGLPDSFAYRKELAKTHGISDYKGTAAQNLKLLAILNDGITPSQIKKSQSVPVSKSTSVSKSSPVVKNSTDKNFSFKWQQLPENPKASKFNFTAPSEIQQREGATPLQMLKSLGATAAIMFAPAMLRGSVRYEPLPKGIPGPANLPSAPPKGWTTGSGMKSPSFPFFQQGGQQDAQEQVAQIIQAYAQATGTSPEEIMQQLKQMQPEEQKQTLMQMVQELQGGSQGQQGEMAYGGQMGYGLDLGARRLWMNQSGDDDVDVNKSITAVPREEANIEAEGGETALIPEQDQTYSHYNIKGKRHIEGGVPLNVPEGTFIYSDTKKMRLGGPVLSMFGKSEKSTKKYTPADLAKQYDVNKYKAILEDSRADKIKKRTAELMIQNYQKKLAQLALVQEGKKGFPQGIPQVAQGYYQQMMQAQQGGEQEMPQEALEQEQMEQPQAMYGMGFKYGGGLYKAQTGVQTRSRNNITYTPLPSPFNVNSPNVKTSFDFTTGTTYYDVDGEPGTPDTPGKIGVATRGRYNPNSWMDAIKKYAPQGYTLEDLANAGHLSAVNRQDVKDLYAQYYKPKAGTPGTAGMHYYSEPVATPIQQGRPTMPWLGLENPKVNMKGVPLNMNISSVSTDGENETVQQTDQKDPQIPYDWTTPDKMNLMNSLANLASIRKFTPFEPGMKIPTIDATYVDPSRALAANAEQMNAARQAAAMFAGPAARYSFNAGQYGKNAADVISQYANQNVGIANTAAAQNAQIATQQAQYDAQRAKRLYDAGVIGEQQYINAMREARKAVIQSYAQGEGNASTLYNANMTESPYYYIDPRTQKIKFLQGKKMYFDSKDPMAQYSSTVEKLSQMAEALKQKDKNLSTAEAYDIVLRMSGYGSSKTGKKPKSKGSEE